ncbi:SOS response-associated peptidase [candidate division WOR-3 bacterium]|nr:SOS response-associated peptidase [candidate division WOR-3 bacterium]
MCGRFVRKSTLTEIKDEFDIGEIQWAWEPSYNVAPGQEIAAVVKNGKNTLVSFRWGLIPFWAKDEEVGYKMINARSETIAEKRTFAQLLKKRRCLVIADGFYEWRKSEDKKIKTPMYITLRSGRPFGFAGLFDTWKSKDGKVIQSCTIITTKPNELLTPIHNRMPVIIPAGARALWLDRSIEELQQLLPLLDPYPARDMIAYEVSRQVNSPKNNFPDLLRPLKQHDASGS